MERILSNISKNWHKFAIISSTNWRYSDIYTETVKTINFLDLLSSPGDGIAIKTKDIGFLTTTILAAFARNIHVTIIPGDIDDVNLLQLLISSRSSIVFVDNSADIPKGNFTQKCFAKLWVNREYSALSTSDNLNLTVLDRKFRTFKAIPINFIQTSGIETDIDILTQSIKNSTSILAMCTPGSYSGLKIIGFTTEELNVLVDHSLKYFPIQGRINSILLGEMYPYHFINSVICPLVQGGEVYRHDNNTLRESLLTLKNQEVNFALMHTSEFLELVKILNPDKGWFKRIRLYLNFFKYRKHLKEITLFGSLVQKERKLFNSTGFSFNYAYTISEYPTLISYKKCNFLRKNQTVGKPSLKVHLRENSEEILIKNLRPPKVLYSENIKNKVVVKNSDFSYSSRTFDMGHMLKKELQVLGRFEDIMINERGMVLDTASIKSYLLGFVVIEDVIIVPIHNKLIAFIELNSWFMADNSISLNTIKEDFIPKIFKKVNRNVSAYTKLGDIIIYPKQFPKVDNRIDMKKFSILLD